MTANNTQDTNNALVITVVVDSNDTQLPSDAFIEERLQLAWQSLPDHLPKDANEVTVKLVDEKDMTALNDAFFGKNKPTNVLAFPCEGLPGMPSQELGDIVLCVPVIHAEANQFDRDFLDRFAHMLIHALLHLMGYDHLEESERQTMEALEKALLAQQGFADPYGP